jgi:hypothetical protein
MAQSFTTDALKTALAYPFQDPRWKDKFLIGSLLTLAGFVVPIIPVLPTYGYCAQIMRRIIVDKGEPYLPEWDDWGKLFGDGLKLFGVGLTYLLPVLVPLFCFYGFIFVIPFLAAVSDGKVSGGESDTMNTIVAVLAVVGPFGFICLFGLIMLLGLSIGLFLPVAVGHVVATDEFAAGFRFREIWTLFRANLAGFLVSYIILMGGWYALSFVLGLLYLTIIFCCLYPFVLAPVSFYSMIIASVLFGEAYRDGAEIVSV